MSYEPPDQVDERAQIKALLKQLQFFQDRESLSKNKTVDLIVESLSEQEIIKLQAMKGNKPKLFEYLDLELAQKFMAQMPDRLTKLDFMHQLNREVADQTWLKYSAELIS